MTRGDHYATLGASPNASPDELRKAYRKAALATHPDKHPDDPKATENFREVQRAWTVLGDERSRASYDSQRRSGSGSGSSRNRSTHTYRRQSGGHSSQTRYDGDSDDGCWEGSWEDFNNYTDEVWHDDDMQMPSWEEIFRDEFARSHHGERACVRGLFGAILAAIAALAILRLTLADRPYVGPLLFPPPFTLANRRFGNDVSLQTEFKAFTSKLVTERTTAHPAPKVPPRAFGEGRTARRLAQRANEGLGMMHKRYKPYLYLTYNHSDAYALADYASGSLRSGQGAHAPPRGTVLLASPRLVGQKVFTLFTALQPASRENDGPATWPPRKASAEARQNYRTPWAAAAARGANGHERAVCVRLLRSGTLTGKSWYAELASGVDVGATGDAGVPRRWSGPSGRLRPFGLVVVRDAECSRDVGLLAVGASAVAALLGACYGAGCCCSGSGGSRSRTRRR